MSAWEQRARKLDARRKRMAKHGRSLISAVRAAEVKRANAAAKPGRRGAKRPR